MKALGHWQLNECLRLFCLCGLWVWMAGCATAPKIDWNSRIGTYTHDQAILELGPPDRAATLTDGSKVVEWLTSRGRTYGFVDSYGGLYYPYHYYPGPFIQHYSASRSPD